MSKNKNYLTRILENVPRLVDVDYVNCAVPHQSYSPREILQQWVRNDMEVVEHSPTDTFHDTGDIVRDTSLHEFEDKFEVMEEIAAKLNSTVTVDNVGQPVAVSEPSSESSPESSAEPSPE